MARPREVWDEIVKEIEVEDRADLLTLALVCPTSREAASSHLYKEMEVELWATSKLFGLGHNARHLVRLNMDVWGNTAPDLAGIIKNARLLAELRLGCLANLDQPDVDLISDAIS